MSRLSIRPRPLDIHKKLPIVKSVKEFEDDNNDTAPLTSVNATNHTSSTTTRNLHLLRLNSSSSLDPDSQEVLSSISKNFKTACSFSDFNAKLLYICVRCSKSPAGKQLLKYPHLSLRLSIHMNETIRRRLVSLLLIYAQEEVCWCWCWC